MDRPRPTPKRCLPLLLLLMLPACQCIDGHWTWGASRPKADKIIEIEVPPTRADKVEAKSGPGRAAEAAEPDMLRLPVAEPPALARAAQPAATAEKKESLSEPAIPAPQAPTDPIALPRPHAVEPNPIVSALQFYLDGRPDEAVKFLGGYDAKDQEILLSLLPLVAQVGRGGLWLERLTPEEKLVVLQQLRGLFHDLQRTAPLVIERALFCSHLDGYGQTIRISNPIFRPGDCVKVYVEIQNLNDRQTKANEYAVRLCGKLEVHEAGGKVVWSRPVDGTPNISQTARNDHFALFYFTIPRTLPPALYTLHVSVVDQDTNREAHESLGFRVAGLPTANTMP